MAHSPPSLFAAVLCHTLFDFFPTPIEAIAGGVGEWVCVCGLYDHNSNEAPVSKVCWGGQGGGVGASQMCGLPPNGLLHLHHHQVRKW